MLALEGEWPLAGPQPGQDRELLLEPLEALAQRRERDPVGGVLRVEPAGAEAELDPSATHLVHLRDRDRDGERAGQPEGRRADEGPQPDRAGVAGQPGQGDPRVGGAGQPVAAHR